MGTGQSSGAASAGATSTGATSTGASAGSAAAGSASGGSGTGSATASGAGSAGTSAGAGSGSGSGTNSGGIGGACAFSGTIPLSQVTVGPNLTATYEVAEDAGFDTTGQALPDGGFVWDLSQTFSNDHSVRVVTQPMSAEWFGPDYPDAGYAVTLSDTSPNLGIFQVGQSSIDLVGLASPTSAQNALLYELSYSPVVPALSFPLQIGASWQTSAVVTGTVLGFPNQSYTEAYSSSVDKTGLLTLPSGATFPVLRVRTDLTRDYDLLITTTRTYAFVTPCFGTIATLVSQLDEQQIEFQSESELRRLSAP